MTYLDSQLDAVESSMPIGILGQVQGISGLTIEAIDLPLPVGALCRIDMKYVASRTLTSPTWANTTVVDGDVVAAVTDLKARDLGEIQVIGSLELAQTLIRHGLVDEYRLTVFPVVLGTGKRLFGDGAVPSGLRLVSARTVDGGVIAAVYRPTGAPEYGSFGL